MGINGNICKNFPIPLFNAPVEGFPLVLGIFFYGSGVRKTRMTSLPKTFDDMSIRLDTVPGLDRQTELVKQHCTLHTLHADAQ